MLRTTLPLVGTKIILIALGFAWRAGVAQPACRTASIEGQVKAGEAFARPIGNGLAILLEPLASGWILRVIPASGPRGDHDYAELATPPYHSVSPLLVSTDFAFRAQDAVGWNPRHFRFATDAATFAKLRAAYAPYENPSAKPSPEQEAQLGALLGETSEGVFEIVDARLIPGTADQWKMAAAVASHFTTTAHTIEEPPDGRATPLGRITGLRFRISLDLAAGGAFRPAPGWKAISRVCPGL